MENYILNISAPPKREHNYFPKNHVPFNKDVPMREWMDGRKIKKVMKCLKLGRIKGNQGLAGSNRIPIVGIKDGKLFPFDSAVDAAKILKLKGIKICSRNICAVCHCKKVVNGKYSYIRKTAGGFRFFFADDVEKYKHLI